MTNAKEGTLITLTDFGGYYDYTTMSQGEALFFGETIKLKYTHLLVVPWWKLPNNTRVELNNTL